MSVRNPGPARTPAVVAAAKEPISSSPDALVFGVEPLPIVRDVPFLAAVRSRRRVRSIPRHSDAPADSAVAGLLKVTVSALPRARPFVMYPETMLVLTDAFRLLVVRSTW